MKTIIRSIPINLIVFLAGMALFFIGIYLIYLPAALIAVGMILMLISLFGESKP